MRQNYNTFWFLFFIVGIMQPTFIGCKKNEEKATLVRRIELNPTRSAQIKLSQLFSTVDVFNLNANDIVHGRVEKMIEKNDYYYMKSNNMIIVYNSFGDLILRLSRYGNGPGEYIDIADFHVENNGNILVNDREGRKMIRYNSQGEYINTINHGLFSYSFFKIKDEIYLNSGNLINPQSEYRVNVWNEIKKSIDHKYIKQQKESGYLSVLEYTNFSLFNDTLSYSESFSNTIVQLKDNMVFPRIEINFGKHNLPEDYTQKHTNLRSLMEDFWKSDYASRIDGYREGNNFLFFSYTYQDKQPFCWLSKTDNKIFHFDRFEDDFLFPSIIQKTNYKLLPVFIDETYVYIAIEAYDFIELYDKVKNNNRNWPHQTLVEKIYGQINEDSNSLIIRYKIK